MTRFLVDAQLPPALAQWLQQQGHQAEHVFHVGLATATDRVIWDQAQAMGAVIVTKDADFALRRVRETGGPQVVWVQRGNVSRRDLLTWFDPLLPAVDVAIQRGEPLIKVI